MRKSLFFIGMAGLLLSSCSGTKNAVSQNNGNKNASPVELTGAWVIENIVVNDKESVRPSELNLDETPVMTFAKDGTVNIITGCNIMNGVYTLSGSQVSFGQLASTRMMCPDMKVESMLGQVLPEIKKAEMTSSSEIRLNASSGTPYIILKKQ